MGSKVVFENEEYVGQLLLPAEEQLLKQQLYGVVGFNSALLMSLFKDNEEKILGAAQVAKAYFDAPYKGLSAGDSEFGMQLIRPQHILRSTAATEATAATWSFTFTVNGDYYVGFGTDNTTAINVDKRLLMVVLAVAFTQGVLPTVEELLWQIGSTTYPVDVIRHAWLADNVNQVRYSRIRPKILVPKQTAIVQSWSIAAQVQELVIVGLSFAKGDLLRTQNPSTVQT